MRARLCLIFVAATVIAGLTAPAKAHYQQEKVYTALVNKYVYLECDSGMTRCWDETELQVAARNDMTRRRWVTCTYNAWNRAGNKVGTEYVDFDYVRPGAVKTRTFTVAARVRRLTVRHCHSTRI